MQCSVRLISFVDSEGSKPELKLSGDTVEVAAELGMSECPTWGGSLPDTLPKPEVSLLNALTAVQAEFGASNLDLSAFLALVAERARELTGAHGALIELLEGGELVCRAATGTAARHLGAHAPLSDNTPDANHPIDDRLGAGPERGWLMTVPLVSPRAHLGLLTVVSPIAMAFRQEHQSALRLFGAIVVARLDAMTQLKNQDLLLMEHQIALATLRESEGRFRHAFDDSAIGMALIANDGRWLKVNMALCRITGYSPHELLSRDVQSITHPDDLQAAHVFTDRVLNSELVTGELEERYLHKNGAVVWILRTISAVRDSAGQTLYLIAQIQDITARKRNEETLNQLATRDHLTGLCNRGEFVRLLEQESLRASRHHRPLSLIMIDVDWFKRVNDTFGHQAGDHALRHVATIISDGIRAFDRVGRYGGEEFAVLLPETSESDALAVGERIRARIAAQPCLIAGDAEDSWISLTISVGIATTTTDGQRDLPSEQLVKEADLRLYVAKKNGKNQCVSGQPSAT